MFQKCQPQGIPELAAEPLTSSSAVCLCNLLFLSLLTDCLCVLFCYKTKDIFQCNEPLQSARYKHPSNLFSLLPPLLLSGESKEDAGCTIHIISNLNLATISRIYFLSLS